jgi:hypothetical protein
MELRKRKRGRPSKGLSVRMYLQVEPSLHSAVCEKAQERGISSAEWVRLALRTALGWVGGLSPTVERPPHEDWSAREARLKAEAVAKVRNRGGQFT